MFRFVRVRWQSQLAWGAQEDALAWCAAWGHPPGGVTHTHTSPSKRDTCDAVLRDRARSRQRPVSAPQRGLSSERPVAQRQQVRGQSGWLAAGAVTHRCRCSCTGSSDAPARRCWCSCTGPSDAPARRVATLRSAVVRLRKGHRHTDVR